MLVGDPNVWRIQLGDLLHGFWLVYVDDFLIMMIKAGIPDVLRAITAKWEISDPEYIVEGGKGVKYLGMELKKPQDGFINCQSRELHPGQNQG